MIPRPGRRRPHRPPPRRGGGGPGGIRLPTGAEWELSRRFDAAGARRSSRYRNRGRRTAHAAVLWPRCAVAKARVTIEGEYPSNAIDVSTALGPGDRGPPGRERPSVTPFASATGDAVPQFPPAPANRRQRRRRGTSSGLVAVLAVPSTPSCCSASRRARQDVAAEHGHQLVVTRGGDPGRVHPDAGRVAQKPVRRSSVPVFVVRAPRGPRAISRHPLPRPSHQQPIPWRCRCSLPAPR